MTRLTKCRECGKPRRVQQNSFLCHSCAKRGARNPNWKGTNILRSSGRHRNIKMYGALRAINPCSMCGAPPPTEMHHDDENTLNNEITNIVFLCRRCHMKRDGRLDRFKTEIYRAGVAESAARKRARGSEITNRQILDALQDGPLTTADVAARLGWTSKDARQRLGRFRDRGGVVHLGYVNGHAKWSCFEERVPH